jgi:hypothetical protein
MLHHYHKYLKTITVRCIGNWKITIMLNKCQQWFITLHWNLFIHSLSTVTSYLTNHLTIQSCLCQRSGSAWSYRSSNVGIQKVIEAPKQKWSTMKDVYTRPIPYTQWKINKFTSISTHFHINLQFYEQVHLTCPLHIPVVVWDVH